MPDNSKKRRAPGTTEGIREHHRAFDGAYVARLIACVKQIQEADDWTPTAETSRRAPFTEHP